MKWAVLSLLLALAGPVFAGDEAVVAEVGTGATATRITRAELDAAAERSAAYRELRGLGERGKKAARRLLERALDDLVLERLFLVECDRMGIEGDEPSERVAALLEQDAAAVRVTRADAKAYYDAHSSEFDLPDRTSVYVFESLDKKRAQEVRAKLKLRETWAAVAEKEDMKLRDIPDSELEFELGPAAPSLRDQKAGTAVTILTGRGYATVAILERKPARTRSFDEVDAGIRERLKAKGVEERRTKLVERLKAETPHWRRLPEE